jgi:hypothetical protein
VRLLAASCKGIMRMPPCRRPNVTEMFYPPFCARFALTLNPSRNNKLTRFEMERVSRAGLSKLDSAVASPCHQLSTPHARYANLILQGWLNARLASDPNRPVRIRVWTKDGVAFGRPHNAREKMLTWQVLALQVSALLCGSAAVLHVLGPCSLNAPRPYPTHICQGIPSYLPHANPEYTNAFMAMDAARRASPAHKKKERQRAKAQARLQRDSAAQHEARAAEAAATGVVLEG